MQISTLSKDEALKNLSYWKFKAQQHPDLYEGVHNLAGCLFTLGDVEAALPLYVRSYEIWKAGQFAYLEHKQAPICINIAMCYKEMGEFDKSFEWVEKAFLLDPEYWYNALARAESLLREGRWLEAWPMYNSWARPTKHDAKDLVPLPHEITEWDGNQDAKFLIVLGEGGLGDRICYSRFLPYLKMPFIYLPNLGFMKDDSIAKLFNRWGDWTHTITENVTLNDPSGHVWTTDFSLAGKLGIAVDQVPKHPNPLIPDPSLVSDYRYLRSHDKVTMGLCWAAGEAFEGQRKFRSMEEREAMRIVGRTSHFIQWVNLKHDEKLPWPVVNPKIESWDDTAAIISNMDGVVTCDCGPMHVAGAMGKPLYVVLSGNSDWKFLRDPKSCPWYPEANLFRNEGRGFSTAIEKLTFHLIHERTGLPRWNTSSTVPIQVSLNGSYSTEPHHRSSGNINGELQPVHQSNQD